VFAAPTASPSRSDSVFELAGDIHGAVFGFFDPVTGARAASLRIGRIGHEYGRQGLFRVAWKPQIVLEQTTLQVDDAVIWPPAARQFWGSLPSRRIGEMIVIRGFKLRVGSRPGLELNSAAACLGPDGNVTLNHVLITAAGRAPITLPSVIVPLTRPTPAVWLPASGTGATPSRFHLFSSLPL